MAKYAVWDPWAVTAHRSHLRKRPNIYKAASLAARALVAAQACSRAYVFNGFDKPNVLTAAPMSARALVAAQACSRAYVSCGFDTSGSIQAHLHSGSKRNT